MPKNYYLILGIPQDAPLEEIKGAYRRGAKKVHPDASGRESETFLRLQEAYDVLSDPERRRRYDRSLERCRGEHPGPRGEPARPRTPWDVEPLIPEQPAVDSFRTTLHSHLGTAGPELSTFPDSSLTRLRPLWEAIASEPHGRSDAVIHVTREQAWRGGAANLAVEVPIHCSACGGSGTLRPYPCWRCGGRGVESRRLPLRVRFPAGVLDGSSVRLGLGRYGLPGRFVEVRFRVTEL